MTAEAQQFVTPLTFEALSGRPVRTGTFDLVESSDPQHICLTERADLMLVAPATNNIIAKVAHGLTRRPGQPDGLRRGLPGGLRPGDEQPDVGPSRSRRKTSRS